MEKVQELGESGKLGKIRKFLEDKKRVIAIAGGVFVFIIFLLLVFIAPREKELKLPEGPSEEVKKQEDGFREISGSLDKFLQKIGVKKIERKTRKTEEETGPYLKSEPYTVLKKEPMIRIAQEIANYIKSQRREDGFYEYFYFLKKDGRAYETSNAWTALSYIGAHEIFNDKKYLQLAAKDIQKLQEWCFNKPGECSWVLVQPAKLYQKTKDPGLLAFLEREGEILLVNSDNSVEGFMLRSIEARELALLYNITKDNKFLKEAKKRYDLINQEFPTQKKLYKNSIASYPVEGCWYSLASIELAKSVQTAQADEYINSAKNLLSEAMISDFFPLFPHPIEIQPCIESYFELYKATGNRQYYDMGSDYFSRFISIFWDGEENPKIFGKGGTIFMSRSKVFKTKEDKTIVISDSAYTLYLLSLSLRD